MGVNLKNINAINYIATSHSAGIKKVLCANKLLVTSLRLLCLVEGRETGRSACA